MSSIGARTLQGCRIIGMYLVLKDIWLEFKLWFWRDQTCSTLKRIKALRAVHLLMLPCAVLKTETGADFDSQRMHELIKITYFNVLQVGLERSEMLKILLLNNHLKKFFDPLLKILPSISNLHMWPWSTKPVIRVQLLLLSFINFISFYSYNILRHIKRLSQSHALNLALMYFFIWLQVHNKTLWTAPLWTYGAVWTTASRTVNSPNSTGFSRERKTFSSHQHVP